MSVAMTRNSDLRGRREEADIEVAVEEERRDVGAVEDVLQVVGRAALLLERLLELAVEGGELLVERLQLLLRGFSSSLVDWNSSFTDIASSLIAFCSSLAISRSRMALSSSLRVASSSCSSSAIRETSSRRLDRPAQLRLRCSGSSRKLTSSNSSPSLCTGWTAMLTATDVPPCFACAPADDDAPALGSPAGSPPGACCAALRAPWPADPGSARPRPPADSGRSVPK